MEKPFFIYTKVIRVAAGVKQRMSVNSAQKLHFQKKFVDVQNIEGIKLLKKQSGDFVTASPGTQNRRPASCT